MPWGFERGHFYNRRIDIHDRFDGQEQGGIITPALHGVIFIITGEAGGAHGYADRELPNGGFEYFGEGQIGDMAFVRGNAAVVSHVFNGKDLLLFRNLGGRLLFIDQMICTGSHYEQAPDRTEQMRQAIVFELTPADAVIEEAEGVLPAIEQDLAEMRRRAMEAANDHPGRRGREVSIIERSVRVRDYVVARAAGHCEGCGDPAPFLRPNGVPYVEPHHLRRLGDGGPDNPRFVIGLCPTCHRRVHYGVDGVDYNLQLLAQMGEIEPN